jgi:hypothetical protein
LQVVTPQDSFGFIAASTPVLDVEPPVETPIETVTQVAPAGPAGDLFLRQMASGTPLTAAALAGGGRPHMAGDDTFVPARPLEPSERVLIYDRIARNKRSTVILMGAFIAVLTLFFLAIGYYVTAYGGVAPGEQLEMSIRVGVAGFLVAMAIGITMYFTATAAVLTISGAHDVTREEEPELYRIVENLRSDPVCPMPRFTSSRQRPTPWRRDATRIRLCSATRGLLNKLEKRELRPMAHESVSRGQHDIRITR